MKKLRHQYDTLIKTALKMLDNGVSANTIKHRHRSNNRQKTELIITDSTIGTTANIDTHLDENSTINSANAMISILPH